MNSPQALTRALEEGFGIETDLRDLNGTIVISHDPPMLSGCACSLEWLVNKLSLSPNRGRIALNIKSDGLSKMIDSFLVAEELDPKRFFAFDMSVPDSMSYLNGSVSIYTRVSEYEDMMILPGVTEGVWVDSFNGSFPQIERALELVNQGLRVAVVSPELHKRDHSDLWNQIIASDIHRSPLFELCTDFPIEASNLFCRA